MRYAIIFMITLLMLVGCTQMGESPKEKYLGLAEKAENTDEVRVVYDFKFGALEGMGAMLGSMENMHTGVMKKGDKEKTVVEMTMMGSQITAYEYKIGDNHISCSKGGMSMLGGSSEEITCKSKDKSEVEEFQDIMKAKPKEDIVENLRINYTGTREVAGRTCENFVIKVNNISALFEESGSDLADMVKEGNHIRFVSCLDKKTGYALTLNYSTTSVSELTQEKETSQIFSLKAVNFKESVDASEFEIPVMFSIIDSAKNNGKVTVLVESYNEFSGEAKVQELESSFGSEEAKVKSTESVEVDLQPFGKELIQKEAGESEFGSANVRVCIEGECHKTSVFGSNPCLVLSESESKCRDVEECIYKNGYCQELSCYSFEEKSECQEYSQCYWKESEHFSSCVKKTCKVYETEEACNNGEDCLWRDDYERCVDRECRYFNTKSECLAEKHCKWDELSECEVDCESYTEEEACEDHYQCEFKADECFEMSYNSTRTPFG